MELIDHNGRGNSSKHWNKEIVFKACEELSGKGIIPTVTSVRRHLSIEKGSDSTVQRYIRLYREFGATIEKSAAPEPLMTALASIWEQALSHAHNEIEESKAGLDKDRKAFTQEQIAIEEAMANSEEQMRDLERDNKQLNEDMVSISRALDSQTGAITQLTSEKLDLVSKNSEARMKAELAETLHKSSEQRVKELDIQIAQLNKQLNDSQTVISTLKETHEDRMRSRDALIKARLSEHLSSEVIEQIFAGE